MVRLLLTSPSALLADLVNDPPPVVDASTALPCPFIFKQLRLASGIGCLADEATFVLNDSCEIVELRTIFQFIEGFRIAVMIHRPRPVHVRESDLHENPQ